MAGKKTTGSGTKARKAPAKTPLLPPALVTFLKNSAWRFLGLLLIGASVGLLLSLISYNPTDPGYNIISDAPT